MQSCLVKWRLFFIVIIGEGILSLLVFGSAIPILLIGIVLFFPFVLMFSFSVLFLWVVIKKRDFGKVFFPRNRANSTRIEGSYSIFVICGRAHLVPLLGVQMIHLCSMCGVAFTRRQSWLSAAENGITGDYCQHAMVDRDGVGDLLWREWIVILSWLF